MKEERGDRFQELCLSLEDTHGPLLVTLPPHSKQTEVFASLSLSSPLSGHQVGCSENVYLWEHRQVNDMFKASPSP